MKKEPKPLIGVIRDCSKAIQSYKPGQISKLLSDSMTQDAIVMRLEVIGEAIQKLDSGFKQQYPDLPWQKIVGLRNIIAHAYGEIKMEKPWELLENDLPPFSKTINQIAAELGVME